MKNVTMFAAIGIALVILVRIFDLGFITAFALDIISVSAMKIYSPFKGILVGIFGLVSDLALLLFFIELFKRQK